ncbi:hypothetical protein SAMN04244581_03262 [Paracoccus denitrificans]|nr:hypothetical protein SAMN04244581_03262 [Paracoccus denitrificans]SFR14285.1 hypothetical protein SAMN04244569_03266 [Paracoccus denitrificans]
MRLPPVPSFLRLFGSPLLAVLLVCQAGFYWWALDVQERTARVNLGLVIRLLETLHCDIEDVSVGTVILQIRKDETADGSHAAYEIKPKLGPSSELLCECGRVLCE